MQSVRASVLGIIATVALGGGSLVATAAPAQAASCPTIGSGGAVTPSPTPGVDWAGCDLSGADFVNLDLSGVNFAGANLTGADFVTADLSGASVAGANLADTEYDNGNLTDADLSGATVTDSDFLNAVLTGANLHAVDLSTDSLVGVQSGGIEAATAPAALPTSWELIAGYIAGPNANLSDADLQGSDLSGLNLYYATLSGANLAGTDLDGTQLADALLGAVRSGGITGTPESFPGNMTLKYGFIFGDGVDLADADLAGLDLSGLDLEQASLTDASLTGTNLSGTDLTSGDLAGAGLKRAIFHETDLAEANLAGDNLGGLALVNSNLSAATLKDANLTGASLAGDTLTGANLTGASLTGLKSGAVTGAPTYLPAGWSVFYGYLLGPNADLAHAGLTGAFLFNLDLAGATFTGANLSDADLVGSDLTGARLTSANLAGANLTGAELTGADSYLHAASWAGATCPDGQKAARTGCFAAVRHVPQLSLMTRVGPPATTVRVTGSGFSGRERLTIRIGKIYRRSVRTGRTGRFGPVTVTVPVAAHAGLSSVSAKGSPARQAAAAWFTVQASWAQAQGGPSLDGDNGTENVLTPANVSHLRRSWVFNPVGSEANPPTIADGIAYVSTLGGELSAVNASSGRSLWSWTDTESQIPENELTQPAVYDNTAYFSDLNYLFAVGPGGKLDWDISEAAVSSPMTIQAGVLYVSAGSGNIEAISAASGRQLWADSPYQIGGCGSQPAVSAGVLYVTCVNNGQYYLDALNAATGATLWSYDNADGPMQAPVVSGSTVYVADASDDSVYAISTRTHAKLWGFATGARVYTIPAVAHGIVYVSSFDGNIYALNATTGKKVWSYTLGTLPVPFAISPVVANGVVYVTSANEVVYALNALTGRKLWRYSSGNLLQSAPVVANGIVYAGTGDGGLYAFGLPRG
jgi:uncharacterized protein YjbI with pentapeptide repeats/outer membrane protein assembly factor BamB